MGPVKTWLVVYVCVSLQVYVTVDTPPGFRLKKVCRANHSYVEKNHKRTTLIGRRRIESPQRNRQLVEGKA